VRIRFPDGFSIDDAFNLSGLRDEERLCFEPVCDKNGRLIYINVRKKARPSLEGMRRQVEEATDETD